MSLFLLFGENIGFFHKNVLLLICYLCNRLQGLSFIFINELIKKHLKILSVNFEYLYTQPT